MSIEDDDSDSLGCLVHIGCLVGICSNGIMGMVIVIYNGNVWLMVNYRRISPTMGN
jgi:hypothetical protein